MLIKTLRLDIRRTLGIEHPVYPTEDSIQPFYPQMVLEILKEARDVQSVTRSRQEALPQSPQMEAMARVLKGYLDVR
jgi:hypothetical protein